MQKWNHGIVAAKEESSHWLILMKSAQIFCCENNSKEEFLGKKCIHKTGLQSEQTYNTLTNRVEFLHTRLVILCDEAAMQDRLQIASFRGARVLIDWIKWSKSCKSAWLYQSITWSWLIESGNLDYHLNKGQFVWCPFLSLFIHGRKVDICPGTRDVHFAVVHGGVVHK